MITKRRLGKSDLDVSIVCLGTMTYGEQNTEEEAFEQLDYAIKRGINFIDCAELYPVPPRAETSGSSEEIIGRWMASRGCRNKIILATKVLGKGANNPGRSFVVANRTVPKTEDALSSELSAEQIAAAVEGSLRRLQTHYIDLIQLHWPDRYVPSWGKNQYRVDREYASISFEEQVEAIGELIKCGKVRHWGLSNETTYGVCQMAYMAEQLGIPPPISIQNDFSLLDRRFEGQLAEACAPSHFNIGLLPYGPLAGGTLTNKAIRGTAPENSRHVKFPQFQPRYHSPASRAAAAEYASIAQKAGLSVAQLALAWCKSRWYVASTIIGATTMEQLEENIDAFDIDLSEEVLDLIDEAHARHRNPNVSD